MLKPRKNIIVAAAYFKLHSGRFTASQSCSLSPQSSSVVHHNHSVAQQVVNLNDKKTSLHSASRILPCIQLDCPFVPHPLKIELKTNPCSALWVDIMFLSNVSSSVSPIFLPKGFYGLSKQICQLFMCKAISHSLVIQRVCRVGRKKFPKNCIEDGPTHAEASE